MREFAYKLIVNLTRDTVVCERAVIADRPLPRMRGLLGRSCLPQGEGLLLQPAPSIHTAFMRFPIDVVLLDAELRIVKLAHLRPWKAVGAPKARTILELPEGEIFSRGLVVGHQLAVRDDISATEG
jgi:uncharacterized protein